MEIDFRIWRFFIYLHTGYRQPDPEPKANAQPTYNPTVGFFMGGPRDIGEEMPVHLP